MSGDYSRLRFKPDKHYHGVLRQQGRVDLDADWNEYIDIEDRRWRAETIDVVGRCGVSAETPDAFKIGISGEELTVGPGRIYVDGYVAENHGAASTFDHALEENYGAAPFLAGPRPQARSLVYLDVWCREVTHIQDPELVEAAVNVDTTARYQTAWQVRILELGSSSEDVTCETPLTAIEDWEGENYVSGARLTARTVAVVPESDTSCLIPPTGGYRGLENHLYRVEVHSVGETSVGVKWSRENAHVVARVLEIKNGGTSLKVDSLGRDEILSFKNAGWVELLRDSDELDRRSGVMCQVEVDAINQALIVAALNPEDFPDGVVDGNDHLHVIRWDQTGNDVTSDGVIELTADKPSVVLEYGIEVTLEGLSEARVGDYWCFAARTADADVEPFEKASPHGIHHHYCKLAIIESDGTIHDCRPTFPALTALTSLFYVSGDGQEAIPGQVLPKPIQVGVANGRHPVAGALVTLTVTSGSGTLTRGSTNGQNLTVPTDIDGLVSCEWKLGTAPSSQQVEARLADGTHLPVRFNAMATHPGGIEPGLHVKNIMVVGRSLGNDTEVTVDELAQGIDIVCDAPLAGGSLNNKPVCIVTLRLPFPLSSADQALWGKVVIGYQVIELAATVAGKGATINWKPIVPTAKWLTGNLLQAMPKTESPARVLAHLTLKGNFIWSEGASSLYLDGEVFGVPFENQPITGIVLPSGDGRRGGDLHMWFWLVEERAADASLSIIPKTATVAVNKQVAFKVSVSGRSDTGVSVFLQPPLAGKIVESQTAPGTWIYTATSSILVNQVTVLAKTLDDPILEASAIVTIDHGESEISVTLSIPRKTMEAGETLPVTVGVQGGDITKVTMTVNGVANGNSQVGTIVPVPEEGLGTWRYTASPVGPFPKVVEIQAASQEDPSKVDQAQIQVTNQRTAPRNRRSRRGR